MDNMSRNSWKKWKVIVGEMDISDELNYREEEAVARIVESVYRRFWNRNEEEEEEGK